MALRSSSMSRLAVNALPCLLVEDGTLSLGTALPFSEANDHDGADDEDDDESSNGRVVGEHLVTPSGHRCDGVAVCGRRVILPASIYIGRAAIICVYHRMGYDALRLPGSVNYDDFVIE